MRHHNLPCMSRNMKFYMQIDHEWCTRYRFYVSNFNIFRRREDLMLCTTCYIPRMLCTTYVIYHLLYITYVMYHLRYVPPTLCTTYVIYHLCTTYVK
jgi:hypothetical protein